MSEAEDRARVLGLITSAWPVQVIHVAVRLGLPDRLADGPGSSAALAEATGSHPRTLRRLLRAMAALGLCRQTGEDHFELTPAGGLLRTGAEGSVRGVALHYGERIWGALSQLDQSVKTGRPWRISGASGFEHMASDPGQMAMFHQSMADRTGPAAQSLLEAYDFSRFRILMDVGGSFGALLAAILEAHPQLTGQVLDLSALSDASNAYLASMGVADRARFVGGSFFEPVPSGADAYMLKSIIHDWDDAEAVQILRSCAAAAGREGRVLVIDRIAPELAGEDPVDLITFQGDMMMLTANGGMERTLNEFQALYDQAGLALRSVTQTASGFAVMETTAVR
ncbi:MAG TPA: methyltransferase [Caulobacteraceae bacterium]